MNFLVIIAKVSHKKFIILFVLCNIGLSTSSRHKDCIETCVNGNCDETGQCVCDHCWDGPHCDSYVDRYEPRFDVNEKRIFVRHDNIAADKPIFVVTAHDLDLELTCNQRTKNCICAQIEYELRNSSDRKWFDINSKTGELYLKGRDRHTSEGKYRVAVRAKSPDISSKGWDSELHLTVIIQNHLNRIKRETSDESSPPMTTNKEPISRQITNFQTTFSLRTVGGDPNSLTIGKTVQYRLDVSLPRTSGLDLLFEIYTKDILDDNIVPALTLYNVSVSSRVTGIGFITNGGPPKPKMYLNKGNNNVYDRVTLDFGSVANNAADGNKFSIFFSVALVRKPGMTAGSKHSVTIGAEYNQGSYVWVGVSQVTAEIVPPSEDLRLAEVEVKGAQSIAVDSAAVFTAEALLEFRSDNVVFEMWGPSHAYEPDNVVAMGQIGITRFGGNYPTVPNQPQHYVTKRIESQSRLSFQKTILDMGLVTNIGEKVGRPSAFADNKLTFSFTIFAINSDENAGKTAPIDMQLTIGNKTVWTQTLQLKISERRHEKSSGRMLASKADFSPSTGYQGGLATLTLFTEFGESNAFIDYSVAVEVPISRKRPLMEACSAKLDKERTGFNIPYVESKQLEPIVEGNQYVFNFGRIQMLKQRSPSKKEENTLVTQITLKIAFHEENIEGKSLSLNVKVVSSAKSLKVNTEEIKLIAEKKSEPPEISVGRAVPWNEFFIDGTIAVNIDMQLPVSAAYEDVKLEVHGNNGSLALPEMRICRFEVTQVGHSMPCQCVARNTINKNKVVYERLTKNATFNDHSIISLGDLSVEQRPSPETDRRFNLNFVATLVDGNSFQSGSEYPFFMSLAIGPNQIWSDNISFPMQSEIPPDMPSDKAPKLSSFMKDSAPIAAGLTTEAVIRLELPPQTITNYSLEVITFDDEVSICGLWISHVGRNMPCLDTDTKAEYESRRIGENSKATMNFDIVANTGPNYLLSPKDEMFANTIEFTAMVRVKGSASENKFITVSAKYGQNSLSINNRLEIPVAKETTSVRDFKAPKIFTFDTSDGSRVAGIGSSALLTFQIEMDGNGQSRVRTELANGKGFEICDAGIIKIGSNYPCFSPLDLKKDKSAFDLGMICNTFLDKEDPNQNSLALGVAIRFDDTLSEGQTLKIVGTGYTGNLMIGKKQTIDLVASRQVQQRLTREMMPRIAAQSSAPLMAKVRENVWVAFNLTIPPHSTSRVRIEVRGAEDENENRAIITVHGLRIKSGGSNIACPLANAHPKLQFASSVGNSQENTVSADLGYISNWAFSHAFGSAMPGDDDISIEVLAQFTDHLTDENSDHTIKMTATFGNDSDSQSISAAKYMRVVRTHSERPVIETEVLINNSTIVDRNQVIVATASVRHSNQSTGEPLNPSLRLFLPPYLKFGKIISFNTRDQPIVQNQSLSSNVDILLPTALFPDVFEINFTLVVDPNNERGYGQSEAKVVAPYRLICEHFRQTPSKFPCSPLKVLSMNAKSSECDKPLGMADGIIKDCQISASSAVSANYAPHLARYNAANYWAPALRFWSQRQYLQIDFLRRTRVTKVAVQSLRGTRKVMAYTLMASDNKKIWKNVNNVSYLSYTDGAATDVIKRPQEYRYYRFVIEEASDTSRENDQYIGVRLELFGCYLESEETLGASNTTCDQSGDSHDSVSTWYSDDSHRTNRHFSADPYNNVIYFCDSSSDMNQQVCYYSNSGGSTWNIIGRSIDSIEGSELSTGKVFAINYKRPAYLSSKDGIRWTPESFETFNKTVSHPKFQHKVVVPALHREGLRRMGLKVGFWRAQYDGLLYEDNNDPKAYWSKCCKI